MQNDLEDLMCKLHTCLSPESDEDPRSVLSDIVHACGEDMNAQTISNQKHSPYLFFSSI